MHWVHEPWRKARVSIGNYIPQMRLGGKVGDITIRPRVHQAIKGAAEERNMCIYVCLCVCIYIHLAELG